MDAETRARAEKAQAHREVCQLYELKENIPEHLQYLYQTPLEQKLQQTTHMLRAWINSFKPVLEKAYSDSLNTR